MTRDGSGAVPLKAWVLVAAAAIAFGADFATKRWIAATLPVDSGVYVVVDGVLDTEFGERGQYAAPLFARQ